LDSRFCAAASIADNVLLVRLWGTGRCTTDEVGAAAKTLGLP
jgi:hypothetical protein